MLDFVGLNSHCPGIHTGTPRTGLATVPAATVTPGCKPREEVAHGHWKMDFQLAGSHAYGKACRITALLQMLNIFRKNLEIKVPFPKWWELNVKMWE